MSAKKHVRLSEYHFGDDTRQVQVLLVYEDGPAALRAKSAIERAMSRPEARADCRFRAWRLDMLAVPVCHAQASRDAAIADVMVLAASGNKRMSAEAEVCLNQWITATRDKPLALVISLDSDARSADEVEVDPVLTELREAAARSDVAVILHFGATPHPEMNAAIADIHRRAETRSPVLEEILHRPDMPRRWGINE